MKKNILLIMCVLITLTSCTIQFDDNNDPAYAGSWECLTEENSTTKTIKRLEISENSYSVYIDVVIKLNNTVSSIVQERGIVSEQVTSGTLLLIKTHELDIATNELVRLATQNQTNRSVTWVTTGNQLILNDSTSQLTSGTFTRR